MSQTRKVEIEARREGQMVARIGCSAALPMEPFIAELKKRGYDLVCRVPTGGEESLFMGETLHVVGPAVDAKRMRRLVGDCKVIALRTRSAESSPE